jgi:hypothetical protein
MKAKSFIFIGVLVLIIVLLVVSGQNSKDEAKGPDWGRKMTAEDINHAHGLPTIETADVSAQTPDGTTYGPVSVKPGELVQLPGSEYSIKLLEFYTHWNWDGHAINVSMNENNPAAKIIVYQNGDSLYHGWAFKNIPFFRMSSMAPTGSGEEHFAFTLNSYSGLKLSGH